MAGPTTIRLHDTVDHLWNLTHYYRRQLLAPNAVTRRSRREDIFAVILRAVIDGDVESAEAMLALHIRHTRKLVELYPEIFTTWPCGRPREFALSSDQP